MHWPILFGAVGALVYCSLCIVRGRRRPDLRVIIGCVTFAGALPGCVVFLVVAIKGDHVALQALSNNPEFPFFAGTAAVVVIYHAIEHLYDALKGAWRKDVEAKPEPKPDDDDDYDGPTRK